MPEEDELVRTLTPVEAAQGRRSLVAVGNRRKKPKVNPAGRDGTQGSPSRLPTWHRRSPPREGAWEQMSQRERSTTSQTLQRLHAMTAAELTEALKEHFIADGGP